jgi:hypothetical protein
MRAASQGELIEIKGRKIRDGNAPSGARRGCSFRKRPRQAFATHGGDLLCRHGVMRRVVDFRPDVVEAPILANDRDQVTDTELPFAGRLRRVMVSSITVMPGRNSLSPSSHYFPARCSL